MQAEKIERIQEDITYNPEIVREIINMKIDNEALAEDIAEIFDENQAVDWMIRESVLSKIRVLVCKKLIKSDYGREEAENIASDIVKKVIEKHKER